MKAARFWDVSASYWTAGFSSFQPLPCPHSPKIPITFPFLNVLLVTFQQSNWLLSAILINARHIHLVYKCNQLFANRWTINIFCSFLYCCLNCSLHVHRSGARGKVYVKENLKNFRWDFNLLCINWKIAYIDCRIQISQEIGNDCCFGATRFTDYNNWAFDLENLYYNFIYFLKKVKLNLKLTSYISEIIHSVLKVSTVGTKMSLKFASLLWILFWFWA